MQSVVGIRRAKVRWLSWVAWAGVFALIGAFTVTNTTPSDAVTTNSTTTTNVGVATDAAATPYPLGVVNSSEPSGYAPPGANAMSGYTQTYSNDFTGTTLPSGWTAYSGTATGDAGSLWSPSQVSVSGGMVQLLTSTDPASSSGWVSGGVGQSGQALTYGAFFVRSRMTGGGPTQVELLWPTAGWPPEVDFDETYGATNLTQATLHYTSANLTIHNNLTIDMTQWHTFGIVWSPASIIFTVDGNEWASITTPSVIPDLPMGLDIQQQTWCSSGFACPTAPASTDVDWVSEYSPSGSAPAPTTTTTASPTTTTTASGGSSGTSGAPPTPPSSPVTAPLTTTTTTKLSTATITSGPTAHSMLLNSFATNSSSLSSALRIKISRLAAVILRDHDTEVTLTGYSSVVRDRRSALAVARARAVSVEAFLEEQLAQLQDSGVKFFVRAATSGGASVTANVRSRSVVALLR